MLHQRCFKRYYAFKDTDGYFRCHNILKTEQIDALILHGRDCEHHFGLEYYDLKDEIVGSIISIDIDFDGDLDRAYHVAKWIDVKLSHMGIKHLAWFSGNKGFHIVVPKLILGEDAVTVNKAIKKVFFNVEGIDEQIYRHNGMLRAEGSINTKSGMYKIPIDMTWSMDTILDKARKCIPVKYDIGLDDTIDISCLEVEGRRFQEYLKYEKKELKDYDGGAVEQTICIKKMWKDEDPPREHWHMMIYTLVKSFYNAGKTREEIECMFDAHPFWSTVTESGYSRRSYMKIIASVGRSGRFSVGCKVGMSAESMKYYCSPLCHFNNDITVKDLLW